MPKASMPTDADLGAFLDDLGIAYPQGSLLEYIDGSISAWETRTNWYPYLASPTPTTRRFDPPGPESVAGRASSYRGGRHLELKCGLLQLNQLTIGSVASGTGDIIDNPGTPLTEYLHFVQRPDNAIARGLAVTEIEFLTPIRGVPQSITINGVWGRVLQVPDIVWSVVLGYAAYLMGPKLSIIRSGGIAEIQDEKGRISFASRAGGPFDAEKKQWKDDFEQQVRLKKRVVL